ncbi:response regulator [Bosea sp. NPDC003192]|uniref:response regulator n=1 Tax=Bosea sp. NPDC003192 TaxID=3390551 RepID=UPI003CFC4C9D
MAPPAARHGRYGNPTITVDDGATCTLGEAIDGLLPETAGLAGTIVAWPQHPELLGSSIVGFRTGDIASGALLPAEAAAEAQPALANTLIEGIEALPEAFVLYDEQDRMVICNEQYRRLYPAVADMMTPGVRFPDIVHESLKRGVFQIEEDRTTWAQRRISFHQAGIGFFEQHLADGRWIQVSERRTASGGTTSIRADITVLKERERDLRAARAQAEAEMAARTEFIAKVGHELRNPLNVVFGIAQLLAGEPLSKRHKTMIESLFGAARATRDVLNDILDVARVKSGRIDIRWESVECRPMMLEMINIARAMADQKGLAIRSRIGTDLPDHILTDPRRLRQILFNLLGNAVKYTASGTISIACSVHRETEAMLRIAISDSGSGIPPEFKAQMFSPYARQRGHVAAGIEGLGLGLTISEELAQAIGARIGLEPGPQRGTRAWIDIPLRSDADLHLPSGAAPTRPVINSGPTLDILVVDDEQANLVVADALLRRLGHRVATARDGREALRCLRDGSFHAVLLDISMPGMSGIEVARRIAEEALGEPALAVIAMTGNVMPQDIKTYLAAGFTGFVEKPVDLEELGETLAAARKDLTGAGVLLPEDRIRFPRAEAVRAFDRTPLDRMVADIGRESVASIVAAGIAAFKQTSAAIDAGADGSLGGLLHKVHAIAGLLGLDELSARTSRRNEHDAHLMGQQQLAALRACLDKAMAQMELYALDLELTAPSG